MLNPPSPLLATTAQPEAERGTAIPPASHIRSRQTRGPGVKWRSAFLVSSRHLKWRMRQGFRQSVRHFFTDHDRRCMRAGVESGGHDRSVDDTQALYAIDAQLRINDGGRVGAHGQVPLGWK